MVIEIVIINVDFASPFHCTSNHLAFFFLPHAIHRIPLDRRISEISCHLLEHPFSSPLTHLAHTSLPSNNASKQSSNYPPVLRCHSLIRGGRATFNQPPQRRSPQKQKYGSAHAVSSFDLQTDNGFLWGRGAVMRGKSRFGWRAEWLGQAIRKMEWVERGGF